MPMSFCRAFIPRCADRAAAIRGLSSICAIAALCGSAFSALAADQSELVTDDIPRHWRTGPYCGVNAVYGFLKLSGREGVSYEAVEQQMPVCAVGSSLLQVKNCLRSQGVNAVAVRVTPEELCRMPKPVIALFDPDEGQSFDDAARGHFVVVISADRTTVRFIDATSVLIQTLPADHFIRNWSGVVVMAEQRGVAYKLSLVIAASAGAGALMAVVSRSIRNRTRCRAGCLATPPPSGDLL
ncbi:MAG: cysteine peptidase family C39 domain-containing protein [Pirellulales bacterium]